jgi:DNA-binding MarR family transcriptional regulator
MSTDNPAFELFNEIGIIDQLAGASLERALPKGMTRAQFTVLNHFVRLGHHERSPAQLASAFQITRPTMTSTLARMERAGLVAIRPDPGDGRAKLVALTEKGRTMRETCLHAISDLLPKAVAVIGNAQLPPLVETLRTLRIALDEARNP